MSWLIGLIIFIAVVAVVLAVVLPIVLPIYDPPIPSFEKRVLSNEHFNGTYLNNNILARVKSKQVLGPNSPKHMQVMDGDNKWVNFILKRDNNHYEDARAFRTKDNQYPNIIMWTEFDDNAFSKKGWNTVLCASLLSPMTQVIKSIRLFDPDDPKQRQKNWILLNSDNLHDTHWTCWFGPEHKVVRVNMFTGEIKNGWTTPGIPKLRGGTPLFNIGNKLYGVGHITHYFPRKITCKIMELDNTPPYMITKTSKEFTFTENPKYEFPSGIKINDNTVYILLGLDDEKLIEIKMKLQDFMSFLTIHSIIHKFS